MKSHLVAIALLSAAVSIGNAAGDSPFTGTWKMNQEKSKLAGHTMSFASAGAGGLRYTDSTQSYTFTTDGKKATTPMGSTVAWKQSGDKTWENTSTRNGMLMVTNTWKLSDNEKTLTVDSKGTKPNGENFSDTAVYSRTAGAKGITGSWVNKEIKLSAPNTLDLKPNGDDGLMLELSEMKATVGTKFDGKDYPAKGPTVPEGITLALTKTGPRSFKMVEKMRGKIIFLGQYEVSADGKTMTEKDTDAMGKEPSTIMWEKK